MNDTDCVFEVCKTKKLHCITHDCFLLYVYEVRQGEYHFICQIKEDNEK